MTMPGGIGIPPAFACINVFIYGGLNAVLASFLCSFIIYFHERNGFHAGNERCTDLCKNKVRELSSHLLIRRHSGSSL